MLDRMEAVDRLCDAEDMGLITEAEADEIMDYATGPTSGPEVPRPRRSLPSGKARKPQENKTVSIRTIQKAVRRATRRGAK